MKKNRGTADLSDEEAGKDFYYGFPGGFAESSRRLY